VRARRQPPLALARALVLALALAGAGCRAAPESPAQATPARLGLMTSLPIYWHEARNVGELLRNDEEPGLARQALETRFALDPIDALEPEVLHRYERLLLAQPRALSPAENVALDEWVRDGGRLLLFADPMLTSHSEFGLGDKRRPQDVILLSPILKHWGLALSFDPDQPEPDRVVEAASGAVPVALPGKLSVLPGGSCEISGDGILARCRIGRGIVTILADAAVLDEAPGGDTSPRRRAILALVALAFD